MEDFKKFLQTKRVRFVPSGKRLIQITDSPLDRSLCSDILTKFNIRITNAPCLIVSIGPEDQKDSVEWRSLYSRVLSILSATKISFKAENPVEYEAQQSEGGGICATIQISIISIITSDVLKALCDDSLSHRVKFSIISPSIEVLDCLFSSDTRTEGKKSSTPTPQNPAPRSTLVLSMFLIPILLSVIIWFIFELLRFQQAFA